MANKRKNFIREKRIYCGEEYLEVDIVAVTNMPEAGKGKKGKSSQAQKNLNDKRSKRRFVQIANTNFGTNDFHISATYNNEHLPITLGADGKIKAVTADTVADVYGLAAENAEDGEEVVYYLTGEFFGSAIEVPVGKTAADFKAPFRKIGIFLVDTDNATA